MSTQAIVMMVVIWGGLALAIVSLLRYGNVENRVEGLHPDHRDAGGVS